MKSKLLEKALGLSIIEKIMADTIICVLVFTLVKNPGSVDGFTLKFILSVVGIAYIEIIIFLTIGIRDLISLKRTLKKEASETI